jgi:hypothetical protein
VCAHIYIDIEPANHDVTRTQVSSSRAGAVFSPWDPQGGIPGRSLPNFLQLRKLTTQRKPRFPKIDSCRKQQKHSTFMFVVAPGGAEICSSGAG